MTNTEMNSMVLKEARLDAAAALRKRASMLADLAKSLEKSAYDIENGESEDRSALPARSGEKLSWAMNDIENAMRNFNFAELARHVAALKVASNANEKD